MRIAAALLPVLIATAYSVATLVPGGEADLTNLWAATVLATAVVLVAFRQGAGGFLGEAREVEERFIKRLDEAALRVREVLHDADGLRKALDRFQVTQQTAGEKISAAAERITVASTTIASRDSENVQRAHADLAAAQRHVSSVLDEMMDFHGVLALVSATPGTGPAVDQLRRQHEVAIRRLGIELIGDPGSAVDAALHDVVDAQETPDASRQATIIKVQKPGFRQGGRVLRRAVVVEGVPPRLSARGLTPPEPVPGEPIVAGEAGDEPVPSSRVSLKGDA